MIVVTLGVFAHVFTLCLAKDYDNKIDRYIIACHTTDFECFKRQYKSLRDLIVHGNPQLAIVYHPYIFEYGNSGTCVKITGVEDSELIAMSIDSKNREYSMVLKMPVRIQQVFQNSSIICDTPDKRLVRYKGVIRMVEPVAGRKPEIGANNSSSPEDLNWTSTSFSKEQITHRYPVPSLANRLVLWWPDNVFVNKTKYEGPLKKFTGNATIQVTYPYTFRQKKGLVFMQLDEENLDVLLDIPDLSHYDKDSALEAKLYEWSEWAYDAVHHINLASQSIAPFTTNLNFLLERIPLERFILLYPEEEYNDLQIMFGRSVVI